MNWAGLSPCTTLIDSLLRQAAEGACLVMRSGIHYARPKCRGNRVMPGFSKLEVSGSAACLGSSSRDVVAVADVGRVAFVKRNLVFL